MKIVSFCDYSLRFSFYGGFLSVCPEGFFGEHCYHSCNCPSQNFICHAADGCVCRRGFAGENCDQSLSDFLYDGPRGHPGWKDFLFLLVSKC